jgi:hypothetical protein
MPEDQKLDTVFEFADKRLGIPQLLDTIALIQSPDEKSIVTYLSLVHLIYGKYQDFPILQGKRYVGVRVLVLV